MSSYSGVTISTLYVLSIPEQDAAIVHPPLRQVVDSFIYLFGLIPHCSFKSSGKIAAHLKNIRVNCKVVRLLMGWQASKGEAIHSWAAATISSVLVHERYIYLFLLL